LAQFVHARYSEVPNIAEEDGMSGSIRRIHVWFLGALLAFGLAGAAVAPSSAQTLTWSIDVTNLSPGPITYGFLFARPIPLTNAPFNLASNFSFTLESTTGGPVTFSTPGLAPTVVSNFMTLGLSATPTGPDYGTFTITAPGNYGPFTGFANVASGTYDNMETLVTFSLTGAGARVRLAGSTSMVPEPGAFALLAGSAVTGLLLLRRRRA
jgi:hypothetical protein